MKVENKIYEKLGVGAYLYLDDLNNIIYTSDFDIVLGKIDPFFRFVPTDSIVIEQGLTPQMLQSISSIIRRKAGIGEKRVEVSGDQEIEK